jgi:hypothetical protein|tara:strand:- start:492 stop:695 length:204 start_codon:yes stop_codon:yes gene_type:complete
LKIKEIGLNKLEAKESKNDFSIYGVFRFSAYIVCSFALYFGNLQIAGIAFGFGASLGFVRRLGRLWE